MAAIIFLLLAKYTRGGREKNSPLDFFQEAIFFSIFEIIILNGTHLGLTDSLSMLCIKLCMPTSLGQIIFTNLDSFLFFVLERFYF